MAREAQLLLTALRANCAPGSRTIKSQFSNLGFMRPWQMLSHSTTPGELLGRFGRKVLLPIAMTSIITVQPAMSSAAADFEEAAKLFGSAQFAEALTLFDKGVDAEPTNGTYHYWRGRCLAELGREKDAIAEYKVAVLLSNDSKVRTESSVELLRLKVILPEGSALAKAVKANTQELSVAQENTSPPDSASGITGSDGVGANHSSDTSLNSGSSDTVAAQAGSSATALVENTGSHSSRVGKMGNSGVQISGRTPTINNNISNNVSRRSDSAGNQIKGKSITRLDRQLSDVDTVPVLKAGDKVFKLSSKKLEWDLKVSADLKNRLSTGNQRLDSLARNTSWALPNLAMGNPLYGRRTPFSLASEIAKGPAHFGGALSEGERNALIGSDIIFVLDQSGSMTHPDCPAGSTNAVASGVQSRISWCVEEIEAFADRLISSMPHGFTLISFDSKPDVYSIRTAFQLRDTLSKLSGGGGTDLAGALNEAFRIHSGHPKQPLLIVLITDAEIDIRSSEQTIMEGCRRFPNNMFITLMQIGISAEGQTADTLALLDDLPKKAGAPYDPVEALPFSQVRRNGFGKSMLLGISRDYYANRSVATQQKPEAKPAPSK